MTTDTTEKGLETLICDALTGCRPPHRVRTKLARERPPSLRRRVDTRPRPTTMTARTASTLPSSPPSFETPSPSVADSVDLGQDSPTRDASSSPGCKSEVSRSAAPSTFFAKESSTVQHQVDLMYGTPSPGNERAAQLQYRPESFQRDEAAPLQPKQRPTGLRPVLVHQRTAQSPHSN